MMPRPTPEWIISLPAGVYLMKELLEITGLTASTISRQLIKHGVTVEYKKSYRNLMEYIYIWPGYNQNKGE